MTVDIVILGAKGRMGKTLIDMALADEKLNLVGACERKGHAEGLDYECAVSDCLEELLPNVPGAVVVDFTSPEASVAMTKTAAKYGNPAVIGTTGLTPGQQAEVAVSAEKTPIFWAPNMSVGINVLLKFLPQLVQALGEDYD
ncbi:MAG TPA: 4-hydroxy-tetrahydrodipicolinate reductase, partial [Pseudodesulfovibrio sp.]|nr:4-hydroxy-tetrahydrodipicolinate reductase [Pseudodesulfovibrio sp.]